MSLVNIPLNLTVEKEAIYDGHYKWQGERVLFKLNGYEFHSQEYNYYDVDAVFEAAVLFRKAFSGIELK